MNWSLDAFCALEQRLAKHGASLLPSSFAQLRGFDDQDHVAFIHSLQLSCAAIGRLHAPTRPAIAPDPTFIAFCQTIADLPTPTTLSAARIFLRTWFQPYRVMTSAPGGVGMLTGYYEPDVEGSMEASAAFAAPLYARPADLITYAAGETPTHISSELTAARHLPTGDIVPYFTRCEIEKGGVKTLTPLLYVRDLVEAFLIQVQGSARIRCTNGTVYRLGYAGRNGHPYSSIGRILINRGDIPEPEMSLARLKQWVRENGQSPGNAGHNLMLANHSFVFFKIETALVADQGPIGAAGLPLTRLQSIAIDRHLWPYGLPFWIEATLPWRNSIPEVFSKLMLAQDTGSAILGPARADIFFGTGIAAGARAGDIRHPAVFTVLLPKH